MDPDIDVTTQNDSPIDLKRLLSAQEVWRQLDDIRKELHTIRRAEQIMVEERFTPQWNRLVTRVSYLQTSPEPGVFVSCQALLKRMIMVVRVNLGPPGRKKLREVFNF